MGNKIGWCDMTFNPVWGCLNKCEYCYARIFANRFAERMNIIEIRYKDKNRKDYNGYFVVTVTEDYQRYINLKDFKLIFLYSQFNKKFPKKPQKIFVGSMSEIAYWERRWMEVVLGKILCYPQHTFQFLTKFPEVYLRYDFPKNCWLGITITKEDDFYNNVIDFLRFDLKYNNIKFVSFEPLLSKILSYKLLKYFNWVILGAETGNKKGKVIPKLEWITDIVEYCRNNKIPVYLKDSIIKLYPDLAFEYPNFHKFPSFYDKKEVR